MIARVSRFIGPALIGALVAAAPAAAQDLNGAGATFPQQIYSKWFTAYAAKSVKINYQPTGRAAAKSI